MSFQREGYMEYTDYGNTEQKGLKARVLPILAREKVRMSMFCTVMEA